MKLAEALILRADLQKRLLQLRERLELNARVQEGEQPAEDPAALLKELDALLAEQEDLIRRINLTNARTEAGGELLTALLARRDCLTEKISILRSFLNTASNISGRSSRMEIKIYSTVPVVALQKQADSLSKQLRELDVRIQSANWTTELIP